MTESKYITEDMLNEIHSLWSGKTTDRDVLNLLSRSMKCENVAVYDKIMDYCSQLHISAYGSRDKLTITT
jgi:hypothetical protein